MKLPTPYLPGTAKPTAYYTESDNTPKTCIKCASANKVEVRAGYQLNEWLCADCADEMLVWLGDDFNGGMQTWYLSRERSKFPLLDFKANLVV